MKTLEEATPQELLRWTFEVQREQAETLKSMRKHLIVIAIPFWLSLCGLAMAVAFWVFGAGLYASL